MKATIRHRRDKEKLMEIRIKVLNTEQGLEII